MIWLMEIIKIWRASDTVLCDHAFNIAKIQNMMDINVGLFQWFINFLIKSLLAML